MMKKILIPTDFSVGSLQLVEYAILNYPDTKLDIILVHGYRIPDTKWDILHFSPLREINRLCSNTFIKEKQDLVRDHLTEINSICIELFTGNNSEAFKNFVAMHEITDAIVPCDAYLRFPDSRSFDPTALIRKNVPTVTEVSLKGENMEVRKAKYSILSFLQF